MSTQVNPAVAQPKQEITPGEIQYLLREVMQHVNGQLSPGKLAVNSKNVEVLLDRVKKTDPHTLQTAWTLAITFQYQQAVRTLTLAFVQAVKQIRFDLPSPLDWEIVHPAVTARRALEAEQSGKTKPLTDEQGRTKFVAATEKAKEDAANEKAEKRSEQEAYDAISRIFFINPRSQSRDERKIADLKSELTEYIEKHKGKKTWFDIAGYVTAKIAWAYKADEKAREQWNSR